MILRTWCYDVAREYLRLSAVFPPNRVTSFKNWIESIQRRCGVVVVVAIDHEAPTFFAAQFNSTQTRKRRRSVLGLGGVLVRLCGVLVRLGVVGRLGTLKIAPIKRFVICQAANWQPSRHRAFFSHLDRNFVSLKCVFFFERILTPL